MNIAFTKMNGLGNDFIVIDNFNGRIKLSKEQIVFLCDRNKGIGGDGLILVESYPDAHCFMNYYNSDGTEAEMCGNGIRCVAKFLKDYYFKSIDVFKINTRSGFKEVTYIKDNIFSVNMGKPDFLSDDFPKEKINLEGLELDFVSMGNPHAVSFVSDFKKHDLHTVGPIIENNKFFRNKINLEIVKKKSNKEFEVMVWERGCGVTMACGTGACAVYAIIQKKDKIKDEITIKLQGGDLFIKENENGEIIMKGEAKSVYDGMIYVE